MTSATEGGRLTNQVALVTGGGSGIGRGLVLRFAAEGAQVAVLDSNSERGRAVVEEIVTAGGEARFFACDVREPDQVTTAVKSAERVWGRIDVLVNNAGVTTTSPITELSLEQWNETIAVDLTGVLLLTQAVTPGMVDRGYGRIINIASQLGMRGTPYMSHYCAAKAGVLGFTRACALELITYGINVNAIAPGPTRTENLASTPGDTLDAIHAELPIGRFAEVEDIVPTAVMLACSDGAYYVGATVNVSGGHVM